MLGLTDSARSAYLDAVAAHAAELRRRLDKAWVRLRAAGADVEAARVEVALLQAQVSALPPEDMCWTTRGSTVGNTSLAVDADQPVIVRTLTSKHRKTSNL